MGRSPFHGRPRISDTWAFSSSTVRTWAGDRLWATAVVDGPASVVDSAEGTLDVVAGGLDGLSSLPQPVVTIAMATSTARIASRRVGRGSTMGATCLRSWSGPDGNAVGVPFWFHSQVRTVAAAEVAARAAGGQLGGGEHEQAGLRVEVAGLAGPHRGVVGVQDGGPAGVVGGEPVGMRLVQSSTARHWRQRVRT